MFSRQSASNNGNHNNKNQWTKDQWHNELCEMIKDLTFFYPLPIQCSQLLLVESFANFKQKDYCQLLYSLSDVHYKHLDLQLLINKYHQIIYENNQKYHHNRGHYNNHYDQHYPLKRVNIFDLDNNNHGIIFHPLVSMYEASKTRNNFIDILANKDGKILSEFVITNYIFQSNLTLINKVFERLSLYEINTCHFRNNQLRIDRDIHCIYHKLNNTLNTQQFKSRFKKCDIDKCLQIFKLKMMQRIINNTNLIDQLLSSRSDNAYHLIQSVLKHNPLLVFQRLSLSSSYEEAASLLKYIHFNHGNNNNNNQQLSENDILYIFVISTLKLQSAPPEVLGASEITRFINKTYNCWNEILSYLQDKNINNDQDIYECYYRIVKSIAISLESSEYISMFKQFSKSIDRVNTEGKKYCSIGTAQMWIETTSNDLYKIWIQVTNTTLLSSPQQVVQNVNDTRPLIQQIMYKFSTLNPNRNEIDDDDNQKRLTPLELSKYPIATLSDLFSFVILILSRSIKMKERAYLEMLSNENCINNMFKWYDLISNCLIHYFKDSYYLTQLMDEFLYQILSFLKHLSRKNKNIYKIVACQGWKSWNNLYINWQRYECCNNDPYGNGMDIDDVDKDNIFDIFTCQCKGVKATGCTKDIMSVNHSSYGIIVFFEQSLSYNSSLRSQVIQDQQSRDSIFPFTQKLLSLCCSIPALLKMVEFCCKYIDAMLQDENVNIAEIIDTVTEEKNSLLSLARMTKTLFEMCYQYRSDDMKKYECCDKILKLWSKYLEIDHDYCFQILVNIECHRLALEALSTFHIKNAPVLFNLFMEKTKDFKIIKKRNDADTRTILQDTAQRKYCRILMGLDIHWKDDCQDDEENSAIRIGLIVEGLKHLIEMEHTTLNAQLFGLMSTENTNYPLFWYSICKLLNYWKSEFFETEDFKNLLIVLNAACNNNKFKKTMQKMVTNNKAAWQVINKVLTVFYEVIMKETDIDYRKNVGQQLNDFGKKIKKVVRRN